MASESIVVRLWKNATANVQANAKELVIFASGAVGGAILTTAAFTNKLMHESMQGVAEHLNTASKTDYIIGNMTASYANNCNSTFYNAALTTAVNLNTHCIHSAQADSATAEDYKAASIVLFLLVGLLAVGAVAKQALTKPTQAYMPINT